MSNPYSPTGRLRNLGPDKDLRQVGRQEWDDSFMLHAEHPNSAARRKFIDGVSVLHTFDFASIELRILAGLQTGWRRFLPTRLQVWLFLWPDTRHRLWAQIQKVIASVVTCVL